MKIRNICCALIAGLVLIGCGKSKEEPAPPTVKTNAQRRSEDHPTISSGDAAALGIKTAGGEAELAWRGVEEALQNVMLQLPPEPLADPTQEQIAASKRKQSENLLAAADKAQAFYTKYSKDERASDAKEQEQQL